MKPKLVVALVMLGKWAFGAAGVQLALQHAFWDDFVGDWRVQRTMDSGRKVEASMCAEWVLKHRCSKLRYNAAESSPEFRFDPQTETWMPLVRQEQNEQWKSFLDERWTHAGAAK